METINTRVTPIFLLTSILFLHIFADQLHLSLRQHPQFLTWSFIYALFYLCIWCMFLWHSVNTQSPGLLRLYQIFWGLLAAIVTLIFGAELTDILALFAILLFFLTYGTFFSLIEFLGAPFINGLLVFGLSDTVSMFLPPWFMFFLGILARRKLTA